ncbi:Membrane-bound lytic murein transglycosylase D precursor [compost metagenome]
MKTLENATTTQNFISKRSTRGIALTACTLGLVATLYNSTSTPDVVESVTESITSMAVEAMVLTKDPDIVYHREEVLNDYEDRISEEFAIPAGLRERVGFWFDIYTRYDSNKKVIHHTQYPWIVFKVIDISDIIYSDTPRVRWLRNVKADEFVASEAAALRKALKQISQGKMDKGDEYHVAVKEALAQLPGTLKSKAKGALTNVRIQTGQKNFFAKGLEVSPRYLSGMEDIFRDHKLPTELTRLPFVESSFNKKAVSKVGASGIWQFMDYTGKSFMIVNDHIDERRSPFKATVAAAQLLKENHMILKRSWPLAITAWNHGPGGIRKAMRAAGTSDLTEIIAKYQSKNFDFASSNFYCEFLAALYAEKYHDQIFKDLDYEETADLHQVKLARSIPAKTLLLKAGLAKEEFVLNNPDLTKVLERNKHIPSGFTFMVDTSTRESIKNLLTKNSRPKKPKVGQDNVEML